MIRMLVAAYVYNRHMPVIGEQLQAGIDREASAIIVAHGPHKIRLKWKVIDLISFSFDPFLQ